MLYPRVSNTRNQTQLKSLHTEKTVSSTGTQVNIVSMNEKTDMIQSPEVQPYPGNPQVG